MDDKERAGEFEPSTVELFRRLCKLFDDNQPAVSHGVALLKAEFQDIPIVITKCNTLDPEDTVAKPFFMVSLMVDSQMVNCGFEEDSAFTIEREGNERLEVDDRKFIYEICEYIDFTG